MTAPTMGFIGFGNIAAALAQGLLRDGKLAPAALVCADPSPERRAYAAGLGCAAAADNSEAAACPVVWLAIKPQQYAAVLDGLSGKWGGAPLVVSVMAGVTTERLSARLPADVRLVRVMPNTPLFVGAGMSVAAPGPGATAGDVERVLGWLRAGGDALALDEAALDAVTALSGSGPAYVFAFAEWLRDAGVAEGLAPEQADRLARATIAGAGRMLRESPDAPEELRRKVTSPGGTTAAALAVFERQGAAGLVREAVAAARKRSEELSRQ